jgi:predicted nucleotidyltransferase
MTFNISEPAISDADAGAFLAIAKTAQNGFYFRNALMHRPDWTQAEVLEFYERMCGYGLLVNARSGFEITEIGTSLRDSGLKPRIDFDEATAVIEHLLRKVRDFNADRSRPLAISSVRLFGSMLEKQYDYGDVDIEIDFEERPLSSSEEKALLESVPKSKRASIFYSINPKSYALEQVRQKAQVMLMRGKPHLSITEPGTIERLGADWREIYRYSILREEAVAHDETYHPRTKPREKPVSENASEKTKIEAPHFAQIEPDKALSMSDVRDHIDNIWWHKNHELPPNVEKNFGVLTWAEGASRWDLASDIGSWSSLGEAISEGQARGILANDLVAIHMSDGELIAEFELNETSPNPEDPRPALEIKVTSKAGKRDFGIVPEVLCWSGDTGESVISTNQDLISFARTVAPSLYPILEGSRSRNGDGVSYKLVWRSGQAVPEILSVPPLAKAVAEARFPACLDKSVADKFARLSKTNKFLRVSLTWSIATTVDVNDEGVSKGCNFDLFSLAFVRLETGAIKKLKHHIDNGILQTIGSKIQRKACRLGDFQIDIEGSRSAWIESDDKAGILRQLEEKGFPVSVS